jgi:hypothetical protein
VKPRVGKGQVWLFLAVLVTIGIGSLPFAVPNFGKAIDVAHFGDRFAVTGLVLTMGGFGITVWQLLRTKAASSAAMAAVASLRFRLAAFEDTALCRECLSATNEIERHHLVSIAQPSYQSYVVLPETYRALRTTLMALRARRPEAWTSEQNQIAEATMAKLENTEAIVLKYISNNALPPPNLRPLQTAIRGSARKSV